MSRNKHALLWLFFALVILSLLAALTPASDIDNDGFPDSLITEGSLLIPAFCAVGGLLFLLTKLPAACPVAPQILSTVLVPPPISVE